MFLSKMELNGARRGTGRLLSSPQRMHAAVAASFPSNVAEEQTSGSASRVLWRTDTGSPNPILYVVSEESPDFTHITEQAGWPTKTTWGTTDYAPLLDNLKEDEVWQFRLAANPVHYLSQGHGNRGKRYAHVTVSQQEKWLAKKASTLGVAFDVGVAPVENEDEDPRFSFRVEERKVLKFSRKEPSEGKAKRLVTVSRARFDGILRVVDPEKLKQGLISGVGPAKAYGCGLLTLAPVSNNQQ